MRNYDEIIADAIDRPAFSNGFEWDHWSANWCDRCKLYETCPLVDVSLIEQKTPVEWIVREPMGLADRYECTEFEVIDE